MAMSVVSVAVLVERLISLVISRSLTPGGLLAVVWIVITYHFVSVSYKGYKQEKLRTPHHD